MTGKNVNDVRFGARELTVVRGRFRKKVELHLILKELRNGAEEQEGVFQRAFLINHENHEGL